MPFFPEPSQIKSQVDFSVVPHPVQQQIENKIGQKIIASETLKGGFGLAPAFKIDTADKSYFIKGAFPGDQSHATQNIRQEAAVYDFFARQRIIDIPHFYGLAGDGDEDGWLLGIWDFIPHHTAPDPSRCFARLSSFHAYACDLPDVFSVPYFREFFSVERKWRRVFDQDIALKFSSLFQDPSAAITWTNHNVPALIKQQDNILKNIGKIGLFHGDCRLDNFIHREKTFLIDWANGGSGPQVFDQILLLVHIMAMEDKDFFTLRRLAENSGVIWPPVDHIIAHLTLISGYFSCQAYRPVPAQLPRLRWMQKSILRSSLQALSQLEITTPAPEFLS